MYGSRFCLEGRLVDTPGMPVLDYWPRFWGVSSKNDHILWHVQNEDTLPPTK